MKKHLRKKYLLRHHLEGDFEEVSEPFIPTKFDQETLKKYAATHNALLVTDTGDAIFAYIHNHKGIYLPIGLPDFTLVYLDFAYRQNKRRLEIANKLFDKLKQLETSPEETINEVYSFYGVASSCIISMFTAIEAFINHMLPDDMLYSVDTKRRTEIYNKEQIQRELSFDDKLKKVLPQCCKKNFFLHQTAATDRIEKLKELRDILVHTKADSTNERHVSTFEKLLKFKYDETLNAVSLLFNFFRPNYVEPCPCEDDF